MPLRPTMLLALALVGLVITACAQLETPQAPDSPARVTAATPHQAAIQGMDQQIQAMHAMHTRMAAAQTPSERDALMAEHRQVMQQGLLMMRNMGHIHGIPGKDGPHAGHDAVADPAARLQMLEKRMEMMQSMMQMMLDRMQHAPGIN